MKYLSIILILISFLLFNKSIFSQTDSTTVNSEDAVDDLLQESTEEIDNDQLYEVFDELSRNPINLNKADITDLQKIPFIDLATAKAIIAYRDKYGTFFSVNELYSIKVLNDELVKKIVPFVTVRTQTKNKEQYASNFLRNSKVYFRSRTINDLQNKKRFY